MQRKQKKLRAIGLLLGLLLGTSLFAYPTVYATEGEGSTEKELTTVDTSLGITYMYADSDTEKKSPTGINLNGNSIIVVASKNSTNENLLNNIYIDKNMNGKIDGDDEQISLNDSVDINANIAIYGVYKQKTTTPISITVNSGYSPAIFGVYEGESVVQSAGEDKTSAISLTVNGGKVSSVLFGAQNATVTTDGVSASVVTINDGEVSATVAAAMTSEINSADATALAVYVNGGTVPNTVFGGSGSTIFSDGASAIEMVMNSQSEKSTSTLIGANGGTVNVKNSEKAGVYTRVVQGNVGTLEALYNCGCELVNSTAPAVQGIIEKGSFGNVNFVYGCTVKSDETCNTLIDVDVSGGTISKFSSVVYSNVDAGKNTNTAVDVDVTGTAVLSGGAYVVGGTDTWSMPESDYTFVGNVDITFDFDGLPESGSSINSGYIVNSGAVIDGNVNIIFNNARVSNVYGLYNVYVKGNFIFDMKDTCDVTSGIYASYGTKIDGNVNIDLVGKKESNCSYIYGFYGRYKNETTIVGGDVVVNYNGGATSNFYGMYGYNLSSNTYVSVEKSVTINVNGGKINYAYGIEYVDVKGKVDIDFKDVAVTSYVYGVYYSSVGDDVTVDVLNNKNTETDYAYVYGVYYVNVEGDASVNVEGGYYRGIQGIYGSNGRINGDANVTMKNINKDVANVSSGSYSYGVYNCQVTGNTTVSVKDSKLYSLYGTYEVKCEKDVLVNIDNVDTYYYLYAAYVYGCGGNVTGTITESSGKYVYGVYQYGTNIAGKVTSTITNTMAEQYLYGLNGNSSYEIAGDVDVYIKGCDCTAGYVYGVSSAVIAGDTEITIEDGNFGQGNNYGGYIYGVSWSNTQGETTVNLKDIDMVGYVYPYQSMSGRDNGDAMVYITGLTMDLGSNSSTSLSNNTSEGQTVTTVIDDTSVIPDSVYINPSSSSTGDGILTYKDDIYLGGKVVFSENVTYDNVHFCSGYYLIPEGVKVTVNEGAYFNYGNILLEGTLDAPLAGAMNDNGKCTGSYIYVNGGKMKKDVDKVEYLYYPFSVEYLEKGGTVTKTSTTTLASHVLRPGQYFVQVGKTVGYTVVANEGYTITGATVETEKSDAPVDAAVDGNVYSFVMEDSATVFRPIFSGNQIVLGKTVADPVVKLNQEYTDENPIYDLSSVSISNDGLSGEVMFKVDAIASLPEGLFLKDNKIFGVPKVAYEDGKKTIVHVTGKNGSKAELTLNIVVTERDGMQSNQEGRITVDETNAMIYLNGNSVVVETQENNTALYIDDNRDGVADSEVPAFVGDLTNYTVYGVRNSTAKNKIRITMNGGTIGKVYGSHNSVLVEDDNILEIYVNGGSIGALYGLSDTITTGTMKVIIDKAATVSYTATTGNSGYGGYYYNNKGTAYFYGTYRLIEDIEVTTANTYSNLIVEEDASLNVTGVLYRHSSSRIYLKGALSAKNAYYSSGYYGVIIVQGGTLPENTWNNVYYPVEISTDLKNTNVTFSANYLSIAENGKTQYYLVASSTVSMSMTKVDGYESYFSVDGADYQSTNEGSGSFTMPRKAISLSGVYVPKQIIVSKQFVDPEAIVNREYTEASPLYDFASLKILDDTTTSYGGAVKYTLKSGNVLPEGLAFSGSKIVGTPTKVNETGDNVTFVVTGRNGTTAEVELLISVKPADYKEVNINDTVTISGSTINLDGTSVVIMADPTSSGKSSIYPDLNHDKVADNNIPLVINGLTSYNLSSYSIYGYTNTEEPYEGDISITMKGGNMHSIYGAYTATSSPKVVVNGDVRVSVEGGVISNYLSKVYAVCNGEADNVTLEVTGGTHSYSEFIGAYNTTVKENVNYTFGGTVKVSSSSSSNSNYRVYTHAAESSTVGGDVNFTIGGTTTCFPSYSSKVYFYGLYNSAVDGNVNCDLVGSWYPGSSYIAYESSVGKNMDVNWDAINTPYTYCAVNSTITGDIEVDVAEDAKPSSSYTYVYMLSNSKAANLYANVPKTITGNFGVTAYVSNTTNEADVVYINNRDNIYIDGAYVIDEDTVISSLYTYEGSTVTIAEGVKITPTTATNSSNLYGTLINNGDMEMPYGAYVYGTVVNNGSLHISSSSDVYGTIDNNGELKTARLYIYDGAKVINRDMATWNVTSRIDNNYGGRIVNYGEFNQTYTSSYYYRLGLVYTTKKLNLSKDISNYVGSTSYSTIYYPVTVEYPSQCVKSVAVSGSYVGSSGVEGDLNQYVRGGSTFTVTLGEELMTDTVALQNVTYGSADTVAVEQSDGTWQGTGVYEPFTVYVNYNPEDTVTKISLDKESDRIENTEDASPLTVGTYYSYNSPLYDLTTIEILNDIEGEGTVAYSLDSTSSLPEGMSLKDGKLYGTLKKANPEEQVIKFVVRGKNQTSAFFTLTLGEVIKNVPVWSVPTGLTAVVGETLQDVYLPYSSNGTYSWPDATVSVGTDATTLENVELLFTPRDIDNYNWETAATNAGATYANGVITCKVSIEVSAGKPTYTVPEDLEATYGQTFGDIPIDSGDNDGTFTWDYNASTSVGNAGTHYYYATYTPNDKENYQTVSGIAIKLKVNKATPTYSNTLTTVTQDCGITLADIILPDAVGGKYQWITTATTIPISGTKYQAGYRPNDIKNYDWSTIEGWNSAWGCVVFPVTVYVNHTYDATWTWDDDYHWHACKDETCESQGDKAEHAWVEGEVIVESTLTTEGSRKYNCDCGAEKTVVTPVLPHDTHTYSDKWSYNNNCHWKECTFDGCNKTTMPEVHTMDNGVVTKQPTDKENGIKTYSCACGYKETELIDKLPHTEHTYDEEEWEHDEDTHWQHCTFRGCSYTSTPVAHTWDTKKVMTPATETTTGLMKCICICGEEKAEIIPMLEHTTHTFKTTWSYDEDDHWHECTDPDCDEVSAEGSHKYGAAVIVVAATEDDEGTKKYTCVTCGYSYTEQYDLEEDETQEPLEEDEEFEDEENQITYMVTSMNSEVQFVEFANETKAELTIPDTVTYEGVTYKVTSIADNAFKNHKTLKSVKMGDNIRTIGKKAFYGCKKLTSVTIGKNVKTIGESAFQNCTALKKITIPTGVITIGKKAFYGCKKLSTVKMGKNVQTIGNSAFQNCTALKKIEIPSKVKKIGSKAFYGCKKLTSITIKTTKLNTSKVGKQAFTKAGSSNYKKLTVKVPKKKKKAYKTMLKKRGVSSKAKIK